jgi:hypothetical protein
MRPLCEDQTCSTECDRLRAAGIAVTDEKSSGPYSGCGGFELQVDRAPSLAGYRTAHGTGRVGLNCEVSRLRAPEGETRNAQRRVA